MNEINCIKKGQSLIHATKTFRHCWNRCFERCRRGSREKTFTFCLLLVKLLISKDQTLASSFVLTIITLIFAVQCGKKL